MRNALFMLLLLIVQLAVAQECDKIVPVNVLNFSTHGVLQFDPERLHATVGGKPIPISVFHRTGGNRILVLVDISGSMEKNLRFTKAMFRELLEHVPPGVSLAYGFFSEGVYLSRGFTREPEDLAKAVAHVDSLTWQHRGTALYDALHEGLNLFQKVSPGDSILLITDGGENRSRWNEGKVKREILESGIRVFAFMPPSIINAVQPEEIYGPARVSDFADETGGVAFVLRTDWDLGDPKSATATLGSLRQFWSEGIGGGYFVTFKLPESVKKPTKWKLGLDKSGDKHLKDAVVTYPWKLIPCSTIAAAVH